VETATLQPCLALDAQDARREMSCYLQLIKRIKVTGLRNTLASTRVVPVDRVVLAASGASV
jgi:hypothetical protein